MKRVNIAYNNDPEYFEVDDVTGDMVKYPVDILRSAEYSHIPYDWEILDAFFFNHKIVPVWINCNNTFGWYDEEYGNWTGAVGKVRIDRLYHFDVLLIENKSA